MLIGWICSRASSIIHWVTDFSRIFTLRAQNIVGIKWFQITKNRAPRAHRITGRCNGNQENREKPVTIDLEAAKVEGSSAKKPAPGSSRKSTADPASKPIAASAVPSVKSSGVKSSAGKSKSASLVSNEKPDAIKPAEKVSADSPGKSPTGRRAAFCCQQ